MNLWLIFLTGLTTGGLSCLAVQGGLLASIIANQKEGELQANQKKASPSFLPASFDQLDWLPVTLFLLAKLVAHVMLGFFLGWLGSKLALSVPVRLVFQTIAALFMIGTALNLLEVHPIFRYLVIQPPKFLQRLIRNTSKGQALFTPLLLGFLTMFIPCGVTQSMEVTAMSLGNPVQGALVMGAFVLGTSPVFAVVGVATAKLSEVFQKQFLRCAAAALILLGLISLNGVLVVLNFPVTFQTLTRPVTYFFSSERFNYVAGGSAVTTENGVQKITIMVNDRGYTPATITVKAGVPVELTVKTQNTYSCASSFLLRAFNISLQLGPTDAQTVTFTPNQPGEYQYNCSMGMYKGKLIVK